MRLSLARFLVAHRLSVLLAVPCVACLAIVYHGLFTFWIRSWHESGYWQFLVPPVAVYIAVIRSRQSSPFGRRRLWPAGVPIALLGIAVTVLGVRSVSDSLLEAGFFLVGTSMVVAAVGVDGAIHLGPSLVYLTLVTSMVERVLTLVSPVMQDLSARASAFTLNAIGYTALREDLLIRLPATVLHIVRSCSGINHIVALLAMAIPLAYARHRRFRVRSTVILLTLPIALLMNIIRITLIAVWNYDVPRDTIHGPGEILLIPVIFPLAIALLFFVSWWLKRFDRRDVPARREHPAGSAYTAVNLLPATAIAAVLWAATWILGRGDAPGAQAPALPSSFAGRQSTELSPPDSVFMRATPDFESYREYRRLDGERFRVYFAWFSRQSMRARVLSTSYSRLIPGDGAIDCSRESIEFGTARFILSGTTMPWAAYAFVVDDRLYGTPGAAKRAMIGRAFRSADNSAGLIVVHGIEAMTEIQLLPRQLCTLLERIRLEAVPTAGEP